MNSIKLTDTTELIDKVIPVSVPVVLLKRGQERQIGVAKNIKIKNGNLHFNPTFKGQWAIKGRDSEFELIFDATFSTSALENIQVKFNRVF